MTTFLRAHFTKLAEVLKDLPTETVTTGPGKMYWDALHYFNLVDSLCLMFEEDNPNFKRKLFLDAIDCPFFTEVRMGVPVTVKYCFDCSSEFLLFMEDNPDRTVCDKCKRKFQSE